MRVPYSYLDQQFADVEPYLDDIRALVRSGDFTLGKPLVEFEVRFAELLGLPYAVGVGCGTDALTLPLKALGIGPGDEVITAPNTFVATVGAVALTGARPVFVDVGPDYTLDAGLIEDALTPRTRAIVPVHLTGCPADMPAILGIAERHSLAVVEDSAQAILAEIDGQSVGSWGAAAGFSLHPLKNLNVWGDGGVIVTRSRELCDQLRLLRNHGLVGRDEVQLWGYNSRLDTLQAVIALRLLGETRAITEARTANAARFDAAFADVPEITLPPRRSNVRQVYHTYVIQAADRDRLYQHLIEMGIEAKIHYPVPLHLQPAAAELGYRAGDFPVCEAQSRSILTLPAHQHLSQAELEYIIGGVRSFYGR